VSDEDIEARVRRALEHFAVPYELMVIDPAYADTAAFCAHYGASPTHSANTIIVGSKKEPKQYAACVVGALSRLDVNHAVRALMGVPRLSFASAEETTALTGMMIGGVTLLALPETLPVYVDEGLMALEYVILGGGSRSLKIRTTPRLFTRIPGAVVARLSLDPAPAPHP
jgi:prolyl-tRNA editing enzyme YbaK/EbsC (Cys-tRNA(Pro) deacylase)